VVGVGLAFLIVAIAEEAGHRIYPVPTDIDWSDADAVRRYTGSLPVGALLLLLAGWVGATLIGAVAGSAIARPRAILISIIVGGLMLAATIANFLMTPHPAWLVAATIILIVNATWLAAKFTWKPGRAVTSA
jgi:predicted branched-subunit amino acid permease